MTDNVELLARAAVDQLTEQPQLVPARSVHGNVLADACHWYAFRVESIDQSGEPVHIVANVVDQGVLRPFFGFNRAKHAVIEAAILATRLNFLPAGHVLAEFERLSKPIAKTAGTEEQRAFAFLRGYVRGQLEDQSGGQGAAT